MEVVKCPASRARLSMNCSVALDTRKIASAVTRFTYSVRSNGSIRRIRSDRASEET